MIEKKKKIQIFNMNSGCGIKIQIFSEIPEGWSPFIVTLFVLVPS